MKRCTSLMATVIALATVMFARTSRADEGEPALHVLDEASDAWLHDHCAYRGKRTGKHIVVAASGAVLELIAESDSTGAVAKEFRCAERPPFWKGAWSPAPASEVACDGVASFCTPPLAEAFTNVTTTATVAVTPLASGQSSPASRESSLAPSVATPSAPPKSSMSTERAVAGWTLVGLGVGALATGMITSMMATNAAATARDCVGRCDILETNERADSLRMATMVALGAGAVTLGAGTIVLLTGMRATKEGKALAFSAHPTAHGASFGVGGRF